MSIVREVMIGPHRLIQGDAYAVVPRLGRFDRVATDPQYDFDNRGGGKFRKSRAGATAIVELGLDQGFDHRILGPAVADAVAVFCHNDQLPELLRYLSTVYARFVVCGWRKTNPMPVHNRHYLPDLEPWIHAWLMSAHPEGEYEDKRRTWEGSRGSTGGQDQHPTVKPLGLMRKIVRNLGGATVLDPFMGTGTTGVACVHEGRVFTGIERDPHWFDLACRRVEAAMAEAADPIRETPKPRPVSAPAAPLFDGAGA